MIIQFEQKTPNGPITQLLQVGERLPDVLHPDRGEKIKPVRTANQGLVISHLLQEPGLKELRHVVESKMQIGIMPMGRYMTGVRVLIGEPMRTFFWGEDVEKQAMIAYIEAAHRPKPISATLLFNYREFGTRYTQKIGDYMVANQYFTYVWVNQRDSKIIGVRQTVIGQDLADAFHQDLVRQKGFDHTISQKNITEEVAKYLPMTFDDVPEIATYWQYCENDLYPQSERGPLVRK